MRRTSFPFLIFSNLLLSSFALLCGVLLGYNTADTGSKAYAEMVREQAADLKTLKQAFQAASTDARSLRAENDRLSVELDWLFERIPEGFVHLRKIRVEKAQFAYPMVEPKLMLSVKSLMQAPITATFGTTTHMFSVGERVDFVLKDCDCFLLLEQASTGAAVFNFGCQRQKKSEPI